jgi:hypothetical protein
MAILISGRCRFPVPRTRATLPENSMIKTLYFTEPVAESA